VNPLWDYFWPIFASGIVVGILTGWLMRRPFRMRSRDRLMGDRHPVRGSRRSKKLYILGGAAVSVISAIIWSGPIGAADRLTAKVETAARAELRRLEMAPVSARFERDPLRRRLVLSGPADDFQQSELVRIMDDMPGVSGVRWSTPPNPSTGAR
jgi:hypothetical protein